MTATIAVLSNPRSTGNRAGLSRVRQYCAAHADIFHYEVESVDQIGAAIASIALVEPAVIAINGGDGTVQATLTELHSGAWFDGHPPPVAVLPNGKTNLIALDLGASGDPLVALARVQQLAREGLDGHIIERELITLDDGVGRPVKGMFLGGAYLADVMLYCRERIYPLGLPNGVSHALAAMAAMLAILFGIGGGRMLPARPRPVRISLLRDGQLQGRFSLLIVTTLEKLLLSVRTGTDRAAHAATPDAGCMTLLAVDRSLGALIRMARASWGGTLGARPLTGVHYQRGDEIRIEGDRSSVILDGELFQTRGNRPIILRSSPPVPFLRLAT